MLRGNFQTAMKIQGATGAVASFFWYQVRPCLVAHFAYITISDICAQRTVFQKFIEAIIRGTLTVNNQINYYTSHPSTHTNGTLIANATCFMSNSSSDNILTTFQQHGFDCDPEHGTKYHLNDQVVHVDKHNIPNSPGNVQLILGTAGSQFWSGKPSATDVVMRVESIEVYYNIQWFSYSGRGTEWFEACQQVGGPSKQTAFEEEPVLREDHSNTWQVSPAAMTGIEAVE